MNIAEKLDNRLKRYLVWDRSVRVFHWVNVFCVTGLVVVGLVILNNKMLGISDDGKIILKTVHVYIGYVFILNLVWRLIWGFLGNKYSRWKAILPFGKAYRKSLSKQLKGELSQSPPIFLGHSPIARLMITLMFLLMIIQAATGLVLAGTDLYLPPFGHEIAEWVTQADEDHSKIAEIKPYSMKNIDEESYKQMKAFRKPFVTVHLYTFYILLGAIFLHLAGVLFTELKERSGIVSAMFTGEKIFSGKPVDLYSTRSFILGFYNKFWTTVMVVFIHHVCPRLDLSNAQQVVQIISRAI